MPLKDKWVDKINDLDYIDANDINEIAHSVIDVEKKSVKNVLYTPQTLTDEQKAQARANIGAENLTIEILEVDPTGDELYEGRLWIVKKENIVETILTAPVIAIESVGATIARIVLNNPSYNQDGNAVTSYKLYVNDALYGEIELTAGGVYTVEGLTQSTTHKISVCGVENDVISKHSNVVNVFTSSEGSGEIIYLSGVNVFAAPFGFIINSNRACAVGNGGDYLIGTYNGIKYYFLTVPETAKYITVTCDGMLFGYNGWTSKGDGTYDYSEDSGWLASGVTYPLRESSVDGYNLSFKMANDSAIPTDYDFSAITITFSDSIPEEPDEIVYEVGCVALENDGNIEIKNNSARAVALYTSGEKNCINNVSGKIYYPIPVPADATSCTVVCDGMNFGYNGWNLSDDGVYSYDTDSGWKSSGATYTFEAGAAEYATIGFKKTDGSNVTEEDVENITITITFA